jgi:hypothetical protein
MVTYVGDFFKKTVLVCNSHNVKEQYIKKVLDDLKKLISISVNSKILCGFFICIIITCLLYKHSMYEGGDDE